MSRRRPARIARITVTGLSATGSLLMVSGMVIDGIHRAEASAPVPPTTSVPPRPVRAIPSPTVAGSSRPALPATTVAPAVPATVTSRPAIVAPHPAAVQPVAAAPARATTTTEAVTTTTEDTTTTTAPARSCGSRCR